MSSGATTLATPKGRPQIHRLGFDYHKPKGLPAEAGAAAQEAFVAIYNKLLNRARTRRGRPLPRCRAPEYQSRPAYGWIRRGDKLAVKRAKGERA
ncbi:MULTISPECIES: hypothetical protein [unclassified Mesorhizobium]|uniref:hypothetical protein n=1 Tax=unclassified Mesorhizobium TaxID=325217 RepID=UPI0033394256